MSSDGMGSNEFKAFLHFLLCYIFPVFVVKEKQTSLGLNSFNSHNKNRDNVTYYHQHGHCEICKRHGTICSVTISRLFTVLKATQ